MIRIFNVKNNKEIISFQDEFFYFDRATSTNNIFYIKDRDSFDVLFCGSLKNFYVTII